MPIRPLSFSRVVIIFNPNSTGDGPSNARNLKKALAKSLPDIPCDLLETEAAGHAIELAYDAARKAGSVLIVSASGDGGYHEVINGAMRAQDEGKGRPICVVLPSGNANDHARRLEQGDIATLISTGIPSQMDLLSAQVGGSAAIHRYSHSYIGLGITPVAAIELNRNKISGFKEIGILTKTFWSCQPFMIRVEGKTKKIDSLVFANIDRMAKFVQLSADGQPDDGAFEVVLVPHRSKWRLAIAAIAAVIWGLNAKTRRTPYRLTTVKPMPIQLDGEVLEVEAGVDIIVSCEHHKLTTLIPNPDGSK